MSSFSLQTWRGTMLPDFELFAQGRTQPVSPWDYKQKQNLLLAVLHAHCPQCDKYRQNLAEFAHVLESHNTVALLTFPVEQRELPVATDSSRVLTLADPQDSLRHKLALSASDAALLISDQWGEIYFGQAAADADTLPGTAAITDWLHLIEIQCPECFPPE